MATHPRSKAKGGVRKIPLSPTRVLNILRDYAISIVRIHVLNILRDYAIGIIRSPPACLILMVTMPIA